MTGDVTDQVNDLVTRSISEHLTERMQRHHSTVNGGEQRAALAKVIQLFDPKPADASGGELLGRMPPQVGRIELERPEHKRKKPGIVRAFVEREKGFEPSTSTLARWHSTTELLPRLTPRQRQRGSLHRPRSSTRQQLRSHLDRKRSDLRPGGLRAVDNGPSNAAESPLFPRARAAPRAGARLAFRSQSLTRSPRGPAACLRERGRRRLRRRCPPRLKEPRR